MLEPYYRQFRAESVSLGVEAIHLVQAERMRLVLSTGIYEGGSAECQRACIRSECMPTSSRLLLPSEFCMGIGRSQC